MKTNPNPRMRASLACESCRRRKVKCDAQTTPIGRQCTPCQQTGNACVVDRNGDRRRSGSRKHVETLEQRIKSLEGLIRQARDGSSHQESEVSGEMDGRSEDGTVLVEAGVQFSPFQIFDDQPQDLDFGLSQALLALEKDPLDVPAAETPASPSGELRTPSETTSKGPPSNAAFGRTSQQHLRLSGTQLRTISTPADELAGLGIAIDIHSAQVKTRLLQSFFRYQPLWVSVVDQELFESHRAAGESSAWFSPFLEMVMLASAARLSTSSAVRALGERYAEIAQTGILEALDSPSPASMQGFLLLSEYEVTQARDRRGWQLCGMACRLLPDLALHESPEGRHGDDSARVRDARRRLLGACVAFEGVWCMYLGRPSSIPASILQAATAACDQRLSSLRNAAESTLAAWVGLSGPMAEICDLLNTCPTLHAEAKVRLLRLTRRLHQWTTDLPAGFSCDDTDTADLDPTAYGVHMQYCKVQILVQQALCGAEAARAQAALPPGAGACDDHDCESARRLVYESAIRIVRLLLTYRQIHGPEKIPSVMLDNANLALVTLTHCFLRMTPALVESRKRHIQWVRLAIESMAAIQPHFPVIRRMLDSLRMTVEGTSLGTLLGIGGHETSLGSSSSSSEVTGNPRRSSIPRHSSVPHAVEPMSLVPSLPTADKAYATDPLAAASTGRMLRNELFPLPPQWDSGSGDPAQLSASLLGWPATGQAESFWA
ncbi:hypothetical protein BJY00DRAFT_317396 [Aspergillus carlsbadensis]|nr:hypothetical protein BJY00DRAFT_317396 [Aspergillus carlsbadensis]